MFHTVCMEKNVFLGPSRDRRPPVARADSLGRARIMYDPTPTTEELRIPKPKDPKEWPSEFKELKIWRIGVQDLRGVDKFDALLSSDRIE